MAFFINLWATKNITKNVESSYNKVMENVARRLEGDMGLLTKTTSLIASDSMINRISNMAGNQMDYGKTNMSMLQNYKSQLYFHCVNSRLYSEAAICIPEKNFVLSTRGMWQLNWYFNSEFYAKPFAEDPSFQFLYEPQIWHQAQVSRFSAEKKGSIFIYPTIKNPLGKTVMTMLFFIEEEVFLGYLEELALFPGSSIILTDGEQNIIAATGDENIINLSLGAENENAQGLDDYRLMTYTTQSPKLNFKAYLPKASLFSEARAFRGALLIILAVACVIATILSVELSRINYKPFAHLLNLLNIPTTNFLSSWAQQVENAESNLSHLLQEKNQLAARHQKNLPMVRYAALTHLLAGNVGSIDAAALNMIDLPMNLPFFAVALGQNVAVDTAFHEPVDKKVLQNFIAYSLIYRDQEVFVFNFQNHQDFERQLNLFFKGYPAVSLSESDFATLEGINSAYQQAVFTKEHYPLKRETPFYYYKEAIHASNMVLPYTAQMEKQVQGYILEGNAQKAYETIRDYIEKSAPFVSAASVAKLMMAIEASLVKLSPNNSAFITAINKLPVAGGDLRSQLHYLYCLFETATQHIILENLQAEKDKNQKMMAFIHENLNNPQLSLSMVAEVFEMTPTYLSRYFKEQFHIGYLDYVNTKRVQQAKELLNNTSLSVKEVAEQTGFASDASFRRVYKKYQGKPPRTD